MSDPQSKSIEICPYCHNEIDPNVCWCGDIKEHHGIWSGHSFVPWGCTCGYVKEERIKYDD